MSIPALIVSYVVILLGGLGGLALYTEFRRRHFLPTPTEDHIFRCVKCGYVYTDDPDVDRSRSAARLQLDDIVGGSFALAGRADSNEACFLAQLRQVGRAEVAHA
jgi:hypothetical protein